MIYVYMRVSTKKQETQRQEFVIEEYITKNNIKVDETFVDVISGKVETSKRDNFMAMYNKLQPNDTIIVADFTRIGRGWDHIQEVYKDLQKLSINLEIVRHPYLNIVANETLDSAKRLYKEISIAIACYTAQVEREETSLRTKQALQAKKKQGVKLGAERQYDHNRVIEFKKLNPKLTLSEIALQLNISKTSVHRILKGMN